MFEEIIKMGDVFMQGDILFTTLLAIGIASLASISPALAVFVKKNSENKFVQTHENLMSRYVIIFGLIMLLISLVIFINILYSLWR
ncbi:MAG: hypothetical protein ACOYYU_16850 [Chloroflexota bacterium]